MEKKGGEKKKKKKKKRDSACIYHFYFIFSFGLFSRLFGYTHTHLCSFVLIHTLLFLARKKKGPSEEREDVFLLAHIHLNVCVISGFLFFIFLWFLLNKILASITMRTFFFFFVRFWNACFYFWFVQIFFFFSLKWLVKWKFKFFNQSMIQDGNHEYIPLHNRMQNKLWVGIYCAKISIFSRVYLWWF